jgi:hypothetical protein
MGTGINFYPQRLCSRTGNCSTRPEPDPLPSLAPSLNKLILETNVSTDLIFSGAKAKLAEIVPASANVSVRCMCEDNRLNMSLHFACTVLSFYLYTITRYPTRLQ